MSHTFKYCLLLLTFYCGSGITAPYLDRSNYWICTTHDNANLQWSAKSTYQKAALNIAYATCKKESKTPSSCKASKADCEGFNQGMSTRPMWKCTALDRTAVPWQSNFYAQRDDAALGARAYCKENSTIPETCYINLVTCVSFQEGVRL
ncbi:hypothetical protein TUM19329_19730 [Legionella antarctica]|uniref:DUF4189 domain-containing protein n=1 Tax=Legionella antarctica TaxID=2708020 RepID=A0A6F8T6F9_9GAMM|nr:hypothetical protein [Legionella antarctica]BCA95612.1 hypothetical protein TUM19329_19730 [Legionella antarctica]